MGLFLLVCLKPCCIRNVRVFYPMFPRSELLGFVDALGDLTHSCCKHLAAQAPVILHGHVTLGASSRSVLPTSHLTALVLRASGWRKNPATVQIPPPHWLAAHYSGKQDGSGRHGSTHHISQSSPGLCAWPPSLQVIPLFF